MIHQQVKSLEELERYAGGFEKLKEKLRDLKEVDSNLTFVDYFEERLSIGFDRVGFLAEVGDGKFTLGWDSDYNSAEVHPDKMNPLKDIAVLKRDGDEFEWVPEDRLINNVNGISSRDEIFFGEEEIDQILKKRYETDIEAYRERVG